MPSTRTYRHFCLLARALEVIGERWSLLIVRDLLDGPQRFTDLWRTLGGITPKWLTLRLRELESAGIVDRDQKEGRREVWYRLTDKGHGLEPAIEALTAWGIEHAARPPLPGESVHPHTVTKGLVVALNSRGVRTRRPRAWTIRFSPGGAYTVRFDGDRWSAESGEADADVVVETTPETWAALLMATPPERARQRERIDVEGKPAAVAEFTSILSR